MGYNDGRKERLTVTIEEIVKGESKEIEYKEAVPANSKKYTKTVAAFANCAGGRIIFGVENDTWNITGIPQEKVFDTADRIANAITDSCEPMIDFDIMYQTIEGKTIIIVQVYPGKKRPYFLKTEGKENGVYIRVPGMTRRADDFIVKELEFQGANRCYDQIMVAGESVTKEQIENLCEIMYQYAQVRCQTQEERNAVKQVSQKNLISWGLLEKSEGRIVPTNGFMLLTENMLPSATIQCAVFKGTNRAVFLDRKEYEGPLYAQIDEAYRFVLRNIRMGAEIDGLYRRDVYELPIDSIREMIVNAVAHRSYLDPAKVQVAIYDDRLEVTSPGMLIGGVTIQELRDGCSRPRNRGIVNALTYMKNMDQWGSGIPRLMENCRKAGLKEPELLEIGGSFRINMFRNTELANQLDIGTGSPWDMALDSIQNNLDSTQDGIDTIQGVSLTESDRELLEVIEADPSISQNEMAGILKWKIGKVKYYIDKLKRKQIIERVGSSQKGYWKLLVDHGAEPQGRKDGLHEEG